MVDPDAIVIALHRAGYRLTEPRKAVARLIAEHEGHFTAADLVAHARARRLGIGRATIFRALEALAEIRAIERIDLPTGDHAYVPCLPQHHHHHIVCDTCGRVTEVEDLGLGSAIEQIEERTGWEVGSHRLELFGRCPSCRAAQDR